MYKKIFPMLFMMVVLSACNTKDIPVNPNALPAADSYPIPALINSGSLSQEQYASLREELLSSPVLGWEDGGIRKFPYPYKAMLSITSDCDSTTVESFERMHKFLNTFEDTAYGPGLGLDIADSFFVYDGSDKGVRLMSFSLGLDASTHLDANDIKKYYDAGWIDSIHAFGDFSNEEELTFKRALAEDAWRQLNGSYMEPAVWIDHGTVTNVQNFGAYSLFNSSRYQQGDNPKSPYYHTDITLGNSIKYAWYSRHSDKFGQEFPLEVKKLRDGQKVWNFTRYTSDNKDGEVDWTWRPNRLRDQLTKERLDGIADRGEYSIVAQHLTMYQKEEQMGREDVAALRMLADRQHKDKTILVSRTGQMLDYAVMTRYLKYQLIEYDGVMVININGVDDPVKGLREPMPGELAGLTFYSGDNIRDSIVYIHGSIIDPALMRINPPDSDGRYSVSISWHAPDTTDYTAVPTGD